jgi:hypothetical protein
VGTTNAVIAADVISMNPEALKIRLFDKDYSYSGHYTVMLNTPRQHKNPYLGFGSPETANLVVLENVGGDSLPLQNATVKTGACSVVGAWLIKQGTPASGGGLRCRLDWH